MSNPPHISESSITPQGSTPKGTSPCNLLASASAASGPDSSGLGLRWCMLAVLLALSVLLGSLMWWLMRQDPSLLPESGLLRAAIENVDILVLCSVSIVALLALAMLSKIMKTGWRTVAVTAAIAALVLVGGAGLVERAGEAARARLRSGIEGLAPTYAAEMRVRGHARLPSNAPPDDPLYLDLIEAEKRWLKVNPDIADIYTVRMGDEGTLHLIVDSETDYDHSGAIDDEREKRTAIGEKMETSSEAVVLALRGEPAFQDRPETDRWGTWVSASVPIYDDAGNVEAALGVDFPAAGWMEEIARARLAMLAYLGLLLTILFVGASVQIGHRRHLNQRAESEHSLRAQAVTLAEAKATIEASHRTLNAQNKELAVAKAAAEAASKAKSAFLANMSHEIRTPLTAILGFTDLLREDENIAIAPEQRSQAIDTIKNAGQHLLTVINDILDLSKIEADKMTIEQIDTPLIALLREIESMMRPRAVGKGVMLNAVLATPVPERIISDPTRLRQILMNLTGNAVKFTEQGSVTIHASVTDLNGQARLIIDIEDTGAGMTHEQSARLFQSFGQADETMTRKFGGTGLGLIICRRLSALMGGDTKLLRTKPGQGSCFRLELPLQAVPGTVMISHLDMVAATNAPAAAKAAVTLCGRILLAEDGLDNQRLIAFHLNKCGAQVTIADNGRIALKMIEEANARGTPFDLLLTDMQMPELDGYTLARTLRERGSTMPIVALTAHAMAEDRDRCLEAGCNDYASKPIDKVKLLATCAGFMSKSSVAHAQAKAA